MMDKWSNRYAHNQGGVRPADRSRGDRVRSLLLILMVVALAGVSIIGAQAIAFRSGAGKEITDQMRLECSRAVNLTKDLSRSGGSETAEILGRIRSDVHAVDVLNELNNELYGSYLLPVSAFDELENIISSYHARLRNGSTIIDVQTELTSALTSLETLIAGLE